MRLNKVLVYIVTSIILSGCAQSTAMLGPALTLASTGNASQAGLTFFTNKPENYGILNKKKNKVIEKPRSLNKGLAVIGIYFLKNKYLKYLYEVKKSKNKEFEISNYLNLLIKKKYIEFNMLSRSINWWDCGSFEDLLDASVFVKNTEKLNGYKIADLNEILKQ